MGGAVMTDDPDLRELVRLIREVCDPLRIILFGSRARGDAGLESDIDVLVVMPDGTHRRRTVRAIYRNLIGYGNPVDVVAVQQSDLDPANVTPDSVMAPASQEGLDIYAA
jgi:predicted nucleotidyltransferase